ncbi:bifunctional solanapyrone synthase [Aspergillus udagawae]|uniref:Bifunctional solanapyrone synthase n=1 Tax=Aspergillus udagawae TaxID=91492 RepID=A0A8H3NTE7_9EURO|nr:bifunctional solanapyrone synthase [Aspergillus udagawae]
MIATTATAISPPEKQGIETELNYWEGSDDPIIIDFNTPDGKQKFAEVEKQEARHPVLIHDIRGTEDQYTLEKHGFQYFHDEVPELDDWTDEQKVIDTLIPKSEELVRKITGAKETMTFTHRIRCFSSDEAKLADNRAPAHSVHTDFTVAGALRHLENEISDPERVKQLFSGRVMIVNVWRPLKTVHRDPLAVCDWQSTSPQHDIVPYRLVLPQGWNELSKVRYSQDHRWYYLSKQQRDEPLVFTQFDSSRLEEGGCTLAHSAFELPSTIEYEPRQSIEIKMFAFL